MPHRRSRGSARRRRRRYELLSRVKRASRFDREVCERYMVSDVQPFISGEILYSARYLNPLLESVEFEEDDQTEASS